MDGRYRSESRVRCSGVLSAHGLGLALVAWTAFVPAEGIALVFSPALAQHRDLVEGIERRLPSVVAIAVDDPWSRASPPRVAIAIGEAALERIATQWPHTPRAALLLWHPPPPSGVPELIGTLRAADVCTADRLVAHRGAGGWIVLAAAQDDAAQGVAERLDAVLVEGSPREHFAALKRTGLRKTWIRADPSMLVSAWLVALGHLAGASDFYVAADWVGLERFGLDYPVVVDVDAMAEATLEWVAAVRRGVRRPRTLLEVGCRAS